MPEGGSRTLYKLCNEEWFAIVLFLLSWDNFVPTLSLLLINQHGIEIQHTQYTIYNIYIIYVQVGSSSVNWEGTQLYLWWQQIYIIFEGLGRIELFINSELLMCCSEHWSKIHLFWKFCRKQSYSSNPSYYVFCSFCYSWSPI
jgi:hypothetical protein